MSIASKLEWLDGTKDYIRQCIQQKGVIVDSSTTFRQYGDKILEIETEQHPPDWEGPGGGEGTGQLIEGTALATGQDFILSPPEGYDGFNQVNVVGDYNLKPENIAAGVTIYGVTGTMRLSSNMSKIPSEYESMFEEARKLYDGEYSGLMILESNDAVAFGFILNGFNVDTYDSSNTEFTASSWVYVAYNKQTKQWKKEDWTYGTSNGNSYIKNIRYCDRYLYYGNLLIYPFVYDSDITGPSPEEDNVFSVELYFEKQTRVYATLIIQYQSTLTMGDGAVYTTSSLGEYNLQHTYEAGTYVFTVKGNYYFLPSEGYVMRYTQKILTPFPRCFPSSGLKAFFMLANKLESVPENLFSLVPNITDLSNIFNACTSLKSIPSTLFSNLKSITILDNAFYDCRALNKIPNGLLDACDKLTSAQQFAYNAIGLIEIPNRLFANKPYLTNVKAPFVKSLISTIPEDIFDGSPRIQNVTGLFERLTVFRWETLNLQRLFRDCSQSITTFENLFYYSSIQTISKDMFPHMSQSIILRRMFYGCESLSGIPEDIFDNIEKPSDIQNTFSLCSYVSGNVPEFWNTAKYGTKYSSISHSGCFSGCTRASNYVEIPNGWK